MTETDICILGGGVMGLAAANALTQTSRQRILIIDQYGIGSEFSSSSDINRVFRYAYGDDELYTRMAVESLKSWRQLEQDSGKRLLIDTGFLLMQGEDEEWNRFCIDSYKTLTDLGLKSEILDEADLKQRFPQFRATSGVFDPYAGALLASKVLKTLLTLVKSRGIKILEGEKVVKINPEETSVETSQGETIRCRKIIATAGVWSNQLLRKGLVKVRPTRQHLVYFQPTSNLARFQAPRFPIWFIDNYYGIPAVGVDGVKATYHGLPEEVDPESARRTVDPEVIDTLRRLLRRHIPELAEGEVIHSKVCLYDMTRDSDFVIDTDPDYPNIVYGYGFSGHGFKFAPFIGQLLAELALGRASSFTLDRFSCTR